ncbi:MAG: McrC family protein [Lachnospiraceae bacterium]|nr:McrC family protein [Lachnospiraceae bacterium]
MKQFRIRDNTQTRKEEFAVISRLTGKVADKTLEQLEQEGIFAFPEVVDDAEDLTKDQLVLQSVNDSYRSGNIMGFLGCGDERLVIESRFSSGNSDYFFQYLLDQVMDFPSMLNLETNADQDHRLFSLLLFLFPHYLQEAMRKGIFKTYIRKSYNNSNVKGTIDIARHIAKNTPFTGNVAYSQREYSYDNSLMELIRHTIEFIKRKPYGNRILSGIKDEVKLVISATPQYEPYDKIKVVTENKHNVIRHAYYREYRALQNLCILILQHEKHQIGMGSRRIYGILFDGAWLWEEYMNLLIEDIFYHPRNKAGQGAQWLFYGRAGLIYPDFISCNKDNRIIADAKYKPINNIGNKDYLQLLAYLFRFGSKKGYYLYPDAELTDDRCYWMSIGTSYETKEEQKSDVCVIKHGLKIPRDADNYDDFVKMMETSEQEFMMEFQ